MLNSLFKLHKKAIIKNGGFSVDCVLKQNSSHEGYPLKGFSTFIGATFDESGAGFFGDSFQLTIDLEDLREKTNLIPTQGWFVDVTFPQMNNSVVSFRVENAPIDRTMGIILLECSASTNKGNGKRISRNSSGGI